MQTVVIGDIHGCYDELQSLLDKAGLVAGDAIISIGDHVDRGPKSPEVLNFFKSTPNAQVVMGNHESKHVGAYRPMIKLARSQQISKLQFGDTYSDAIAFMASLPLHIELPEASLVHGYVEPGVPWEDQHPIVLLGMRISESRLQQLYDRPWYELYDGDKPVIVGHQNYTGTDQPFAYKDRVFGLDTSCVVGKALTGLLLPSFRFVSVPSRADHWMKVSQQYPRRTQQTHPKPLLHTWTEDEEQVLADLIEKAYRISETIMDDLRTEPGYTDMSPRAQARLFCTRVGNNITAALLQLARLRTLNPDLARQILKTPVALSSVLERIEAMQ